MHDIWAALADHRNAHRGQSIAALCADPARAPAFSVAACGMVLDASRTAIDPRARALLLDLYRASGAADRIRALFAGEAVNTTEDRAVLHVALRAEAGPILTAGLDVLPGVADTLTRMRRFAQGVRDGSYWVSGNPVRDVVNIGIGGSDLGPAMATRALSPWADGPRVHFVANVDGADLADVLAGLDPAGTLFIIASKSFTTIETMTNARAARAWLEGQVAEPGRHFAAVSSALGRTKAFGIHDERVFGFEDWVGGRYSVWGPVGLALMIAIGPEAFDDFRAGAAAMDRHFRDTAPEVNMPVWLALTGLWHHQVCAYPTRAVLPYAQRLARLPAYLQQLEMESNGKRVTLDGQPVARPAGPVVWGEPGTNGQHAFFQLLHQGAQVVPCEFLLFARGIAAGDEASQRLLLANGLAQAQALMQGRSEAEILATLPEMDPARAVWLARHCACPGNRPSVTLAAPVLDPFTLGAIIALYEHRVLVEGAVLGINSFDQWGVELGKDLALQVAPLLEGEDGGEHDPATRHLAAVLRGMAEV